MGRGCLSVEVCDCRVWECLRGASLLLEPSGGESGNEDSHVHGVTPAGEAMRC